jgi:hypothetical protein
MSASIELIDCSRASGAGEAPVATEQSGLAVNWGSMRRVHCVRQLYGLLIGGCAPVLGSQPLRSRAQAGQAKIGRAGGQVKDGIRDDGRIAKAVTTVTTDAVSPAAGLHHRVVR